MNTYRIKTLRKLSHIPCEVKEGSIVYDCIQSDYGTASDDTAIYNEEYISVTLDPDGDYPFFTYPKKNLELVD